MERERGTRWDLKDPRFARVQTIFARPRTEHEYDEARALLRELVQENAVMAEVMGTRHKGRRPRPPGYRAPRR